MKYAYKLSHMAMATSGMARPPQVCLHGPHMRNCCFRGFWYAGTSGTPQWHRKQLQQEWASCPLPLFFSLDVFNGTKSIKSYNAATEIDPETASCWS